MLLPSTVQSALLLLVLSFVCLGSWANFFKTSRWRYELFYFDFAIGAVLLAVIAAYSLGMLGTDMSFQDRMVVAGTRSEALAVCAGLAFGLGNLLLLAGIALEGMAIAFPFAFSLAFLIAAALHLQATALLGSSIVIVLYLISFCSMFAAAVSGTTVKASPGAAGGKRSPARHAGSYAKIVSVSVVAGILLGVSQPLGDAAFWGDLGLGAYAGTVMFTVGLVIATVLFNIFFMNMGLVGGRVTLPAFRQAKMRQHVLGVVAGMVWAGGLLTALLSHVPSLPSWSIWLREGWVLLAVAWGLLIWKELATAPKLTRVGLSIGSLTFAGAIAASWLTGY